jgi:TPR repeat protein/serine/threonine protein kinase
VDVVELFSEGLSSEQRMELEACLRSFEASWDEASLGMRLRTLPEEPLRRPALMGMIAIDLLRRRESGHRVSIRSYLKKVPEMGNIEDVPAALLLVEYLARRKMGEEVAPDDFSERFPTQIDALRKLVADMPDVPAESAPAEKGDAKGSESDSSNVPLTFGRYQILRKLGRGGMGQVYLARDTVLGREVALKVPRLDKNDPIVHARFLREAQLAAQLHHPNLCTVHDAGVEKGIHFLTMSYIEGTLLSDLIREGRRWQRNDAAELVRQLARGLAHAHSKGVIHRDLKPSNVMLRPTGEPIIMDFGLARQVQSEDQRLTRIGSTMGTPIYMSPEQARGDRDQTGSGDIYSLGIILYEVLTGKVPFEGSNFEILSKILLDPPTPPSAHNPDIDQAMEAICLKALEKTPEKRYRTMEDFARALEEYLHIPVVQPEAPLGRPEPAPPPEPKSQREARDDHTVVARRKGSPQTMIAEEPRRKRDSDTVFDFEERDRPVARPTRRKAPERRGKSTPDIPPGLLIGGGIALGCLLVGLVVLVVVVRAGRRADDKAEVTPPVVGPDKGKKGPDRVNPPVDGQQDVKADIAALNAWLLAGKDGNSYVNEYAATRLNAWRQSAKEGVVEGQFLLGLYYLVKGTTEADRKEAASLFRKAAEKGHASAQNELGHCYARGFGVPRNPQEAVAWYSKAAAQGDPNGENNMGVCYDRGEGVTQDFKQAVDWFRRAADRGHAGAQYNLGLKYEGGEGVTKDMAQAIAWYRKSAEKGFATAQYKLGRHYALGIGVPKDVPSAVLWYGKAAEQGHMIAQFEMGHYYAARKDYIQAISLFRKSAMQGYPPAMNNLGHYYYQGLGGVAKDPKQASEWFRKAADSGDADAKYNLGLCYAKGDGVERNLAEANRLWQEAAGQWQKAAEAGDVNAKYKLGECYMNGQGVVKNPVEAIRLWREAAAVGHQKAKEALRKALGSGRVT